MSNNYPYIYIKFMYSLQLISYNVPEIKSSGTGTNFIRAVPKIERSVNGALVFFACTWRHYESLGAILVDFKLSLSRL